MIRTLHIVYLAGWLFPTPFDCAGTPVRIGCGTRHDDPRPDNLYDEDLLESVCAGLVVMDWTYTNFTHFQPEGPLMRFVRK